MVEKLKEVSSVTTTNSYAELISVAVPQQISKVLIHLKEENTNAIKYKIEASQTRDFQNFETLKDETALAKNASAYEVVSIPWLYLRVLHKSANEDAHGKTSCIITGS